MTPLLENLPRQSLAFSLILLPATYFLAPTATVSFFPSYLIGIFGLIILATDVKSLRWIWQSSVPLLLLFAALLFGNLKGGFGIESTLLYLGYVVLILTFVFGLVLSAIRLPWFLTAFMVVVVGSAVVSSLFSIGFYFFLDYQPLVEQRLYALGRLNNPVISALSYGVVLSLCFSSIAFSKENGLRGIATLASIVLMVAIILTGTRGAWLGLLAATCAIVLIRDWRSTQQFSAVAATLVIIPTAIVAILYYFDIADSIFKRSFSFRPEIWLKTLEEWHLASVVFGAGLDAQVDLRVPPHEFHHPHSIYLSTLYYGGLLSLALLASLVGRLIWVALNQSDRDTTNYALPCLVFGLTTLIFDGNKIVSKIDFVWLCLWFPIALMLLAEFRFKQPTQRPEAMLPPQRPS